MHFLISNQKTGRNKRNKTNEREPQITNAKREAHPEIQIEFNSICPINFPVFSSPVILFRGFLVLIPRAKVALYDRHTTL